MREDSLITPVIKTILKVQLTLDYMKLCVDHEKANGEGVPVDIVVMPDFVVDVDGKDIEDLNKEDHPDPYGMLSPAKIGSRAGRVLSILSHLRDLDDEAFRLHYIAKTGHIGKVVLKDRLNQRLLKNHLQPLRFPLLTPAPRTRYAAINPHLDDKEKRRQVLRLKDQDILRKEELERHFYTPIDKIRNARALYFATDSVAQFKELFDIVVLGERIEDAQKRLNDSTMLKKDTPGLRHVIIDISALHENEDSDRPLIGLPEHEIGKIKKVLDTFKKRNNKESSVKSQDKPNFLVCNTRLTFLVRGALDEDNWKKIKKTLGIRKLEDQLLLYDKQNMVWSDNVTKSSIKLPWDSNSPDSREAFIAGLLLYRSVGSAWACIPEPKRFHLVNTNWPKDIFPDPYITDKKAEKEWTFDDAFLFGKAMTTFWPDSCVDIPDKRSLLLCNCKKENAFNATNSNLIINRLSIDKPIEWFLNVSLLALKFINEASRRLPDGSILELKKKDLKSSKTASKKNNDGTLSNFISMLKGIVLNRDLKMSPVGWISPRHQVLKLTDMHTLYTQFALQTLRRMARISGQKKISLYSGTYAYLSDLDGTLIKSSTIRNLCLKRAFLAMITDDNLSKNNPDCFPLLPANIFANHPITPISPEGTALTVSQFLERCCSFYNALIYKQDKLWQAIFEKYTYYAHGELPKDFRQVWNHPLSYPVFVWALNFLLNEQDLGEFDNSIDVKSTLIKAMSTNDGQWILDIPGMDEHEDWGKEKLLEGLSDYGVEIKEIIIDKEKEYIVNYTPGLIEFHKKVATLDTRNRRTFDKAVEYYWNVEYEPFSQTREVLRTLRDVLGVKLYVATEGHHDTQVKKIRNVRLDDFFPEAVIMSTGAASSSFEDIQNIKEAIQKQIDKITSLNTKQEEDGEFSEDIRNELKGKPNYEEQLLIYSHIFKNRNNKHEKDKEKSEKEMLFLKKYEEQWDNFLKKEDGGIYNLIVASVMVDSESPLLSLTNLKHLELNLVHKNEKVSPIKFAMIGDREDKDICPILDNWNNKEDPVATIRLLTSDHNDKGHYWKGGEDKTKGKVDPKAHYVAWSPMQSLLLLSAESSWKTLVKYGMLPEIIPGHLADADGKIDDWFFNMITWGRALGSDTFGLINHLIIQSTIHNQKKKTFFVERIYAKMLNCRKSNDWDGYFLAWDILEQIFSVVARSGENVKDIARSIYNIIKKEYTVKFGSQNNIEYQVYDLLHYISEYYTIPEGFIKAWPLKHSQRFNSGTVIKTKLIAEEKRD